jgi:SAM-dependent methyltransferase
MIIHKLIWGFLRRRGGSPEFYQLQARDAITWLQKKGVTPGPALTVLDLGCGFGDFGGELARLGCRVTLADDESYVLPEYSHLPFRRFNIDQDDFGSLGQFDLVICSNVLEHLPRPERLLASAHLLLNPTGKFYLSWTNWLSPWGGHEFSPFHYLGVSRGHWIYDKLVGKPRPHTPFKNLFPTRIGSVLRTLKANPHIRIARIAPRYYPEFAFIVRLPLAREFLTWNCAVLLEWQATASDQA